MISDFVRIDEEMLLGRARELLAQPPPDHDSLWETAQRIGALKHYVTELAAALELRRDAELPGMSAPGDQPADELAVTDSDSGGRVYRLRDGRAVDPPNPARDIYPVYPPWLSETTRNAP